MIKQFVRSEFCLNKCNYCCRFSQPDSIWSPSLLDEEIKEFLKNNICSSVISQSKKIKLIPFPKESNSNLTFRIFICPFLNYQDSKCKIFSSRPFECQLYPFLINRRNKKIFLAVDLGCPFIKENLYSQEFKEYTQYLADFLNNPHQLNRLKDNPQIIQAYQEAKDLIELNL